MGENCLTGCDAGKCTVETRALDDQASKPPSLSESFGLYDATTGKSQDPCALYQDGDRICVKGKAIMCKTKFGKLMSWSQENCLAGCDAGKCTDEVRALDDKAPSQASKPPPLSEAFGLYDSSTGKMQDPCELYQDGDRICVKGKATMCKKKYGKLMSWSQENCLMGCEGSTGKCIEDAPDRALKAPSQASKAPPLSKAYSFQGPSTGLSQDRCALYQEGDRICVNEKSIVCEKKLGKLMSGPPENCLNGCDEWTGKCTQ